MPENRDGKAPNPAGPRATAAARTRPALLQCVDTSVLKDGVGAQISLDDGAVTVGRDATNAVCLNAQGVSRFHARLHCENGAWLVNDLGSTNGTRVNNSRISENQALKHGDTVAFGRACYKFRLLSASNDAAATGLDIDLGATARIQAPGAGAAAKPDAQAAAAAKPDAQAAAAETRSPAAARPAAAKRHGHRNPMLWAIVIAAFAAIVIGGARLVGVI